MSCALVLHSGTNIGEVEVDHGRNVDQIGNTLNCLLQNFIRHLEAFFEAHALACNIKELVIRNNDQSINVVSYLIETGHSISHTRSAFHGERLGHDTNRKDTLLLSGLSDNGSCTCSGSATHTTGNKDHICTLHGCGQIF